MLLRKDPTGYELDREQLTRLASAFCGKAVHAEIMTASAQGLMYCYQGYSGRIALVTRDDVAEQVSWLWDISVLYTGALNIIAESLHNRAISLVREPSTHRRSERQLELLRRLEFVVGVIQYEGRPEVFGGSALESAIYSTTWREWDGDKLVRAVNDRRDFFRSVIDSLSKEISPKLAIHEDQVWLALVVG